MSNLDGLKLLTDFSESELKTLIAALLEGAGREVSTGEIEGWINHWNNVLAEAAILGLILKGQVVAQWSPEQDDWVFRNKDREA